FTALFNLSTTLYAQGEIDEAIERLRQTILINPNSGLAFRNLGYMLYQKKRLPEALEMLQKALQLNPDDISLRTKLTEITQELDGTGAYARYQSAIANGNLEAAQSAILKALERSPNHSPYITALSNLGSLYHEQDRLDKAKTIYLDVLDRNPDRLEAQINLGILYYSQRQYQQSVVTFERAIELAPEDVEALLGLAQAYEKTGQRPDADRTYQRILALDPENSVARNRLQSPQP
ncbi:MAG: tetratricopeptide repeat protein, partial [bacterium]|nr:tetratricopeptide repeat protein [bacterium]